MDRRWLEVVRSESGHHGNLCADAGEKFSDAPLVDCPTCKAPELKKLLSMPGFRLKGSGWYETDFKKIQPGCVTFAWRAGLTKEALVAAVENNARILLCPGEHCYFDYPMAKGDMPEVNWGMPVTSLKAAYSLDPAWGMGEDV